MSDSLPAQDCVISKTHPAPHTHGERLPTAWAGLNPHTNPTWHLAKAAHPVTGGNCAAGLHLPSHISASGQNQYQQRRQRGSTNPFSPDNRQQQAEAAFPLQSSNFFCILACNFCGCARTTSLLFACTVLFCKSCF